MIFNPLKASRTSFSSATSATVTSNPGSPAIALSVDGATLLAGASGATIGSDANQGAAYLFLPEPTSAAALAAGAAMLARIGARSSSARRKGTSIGGPEQ